MIQQKRVISSLMVTLLGISMFSPAFGEVSTLQANKSLFIEGEEIIFSGTLDEDLRGLVSIVIRDPNDEFVMLAQSMIDLDGTYKKSVIIDSGFKILGNYNATAFVYNMTSGKTVDFTISNQVVTQAQRISSIDNEIIPEPPKIPESKIADFVDPTKDPKEYVERYHNEPSYKAWFDRNYPGISIEEAVGYAPPESKIADFVDPTKDPKEYVERYHNEPSYKAWFDRNYPGISIEEAVGYVEISAKEPASMNNIIKKDIIPNAEASSEINNVIIEPEDNSQAGPMVLAIGGLVVLFAAVYGIKRQADNNSRQISLNRDIIKKKLTGIFRHNSLGIIENRLAKGEISIKEYEQLVKAIKQN